MDTDFIQIIFYIIAGVLYLVFRGIGSSKNKKPKPKPISRKNQSPQPSTSSSDELSDLETILKDMFASEEEKKKQAEADALRKKEEQRRAQEERIARITRKRTSQFKEMGSSEVVDLDDRENKVVQLGGAEEITEDLDYEFDLRDAVIGKIILERKYF